MIINGMVMALIGLLSRVPFAGKAVTAVVLLLIDILGSFGDLSVLVGLPGWISFSVGAILFGYLCRMVYKFMKHRRERGNATLQIQPEEDV